MVRPKRRLESLKTFTVYTFVRPKAFSNPSMNVLNASGYPKYSNVPLHLQNETSGHCFVCPM